MPRRARRILGGCVYHVLNRSAGRVRIFHKAADYDAFERIRQEVRKIIPLRLLGWCLMPNHWHMVVWPDKNEGQMVSEFMRRLAVTHATRWRWHRHNVGDGPVYQGRFKAFPVENDRHYLTALRYVETNAWRSGLCQCKPAENWRWSSLWNWAHKDPNVRRQVEAGPLDRPAGWLRLVNTPMNAKELEVLRRCVNRGVPLGGETWVASTAQASGVPYPPRDRGRPRRDKRVGLHK